MHLVQNFETMKLPTLTEKFGSHKCAVCGSVKTKLSLDLSMPYMGSSETYELWKCLDCGHGETFGRRDEEFLQQIYGSFFFSSSQQNTCSPSSSININARERIIWLSQIGKGKLLDVGCGKGAFLAAASKHFVVEGVEFSKVAAEAASAQGIPIHCGDFFQLELPHEEFDVVTFWDVFASLDNPSDAMSRVRPILKDNGHLILTVPLLDSIMARVMGRFWPMLIPPINLHYFTQDSLCRLAASKGFEVISITREGKMVSLDFIALKLCRSLRLKKIFHTWAAKLPPKPIRVNTRDLATVVLKVDERQLS